MKLLLGTLPGRALVIGFAVRLADLAMTLWLGRVPAAVGAIDMAASVAIALAAIYFLAQAAVAVRRRLLWRVRRKLIFSYIFIGLVPALLLCAFFVLGGILLFYNFSAYLVRNEFQQLTSRVQAVATTAAAEIQRAGGRDVDDILQRRRLLEEPESPGIALSMVTLDRGCHATKTSRQNLPAWIDCRGFAGIVKSPLAIRAVAFPGEGATYAVVADLPVDAMITALIRGATGVEIGTMPPDAGSPTLASIAYLASINWTTGQESTLQMPIRLGLGEIYDRISAAPGLDGTRNVVIVLLELVGGLFLVIEVVALMAGFGLARSITGSVHELSVGTERVGRGDFSQPIAVATNDQLGELARQFNGMTGHIAALLRESDEKKRLEEELRIAHDIQMSLLPQGPLRMPGVTVAGTCVPAREVGGDYYDFLPLDDHRVGLLIADVAGKGTFAALYMAELKGLVLSLSRVYSSPRDLLIQANRLIAEHLSETSFITMIYAVVDLEAGNMTYARAGHTPLIYLPESSSGPRLARLLSPDGLVLGLKIDGGQMFERLLEEHTIPLNPGDVYLFFTDGISEAMNEGADFFGEIALARLLERCAHLGAEDLLERILGEITTFVGDALPYDDMTMILLKMDGPDAPPHGVHLERAEAAETRA